MPDPLVQHPLGTVDPMTTEVEAIYYPEEEHDVTGTDEHLSWIILLRENLRTLLAGPHCYVGGDIFWYPVEGHPEIRASPDTMVVFGRPQAQRRTWMNWREEGLGPQVTIEVLSEVNREPRGRRILADKLVLYEQHGVEEYIELDPDVPSIEVWLRGPSGLEHQGRLTRWHSARLGVTFLADGLELEVRGPAGERFATLDEVAARAEAEAARAEAEAARAELEAARAEAEAARAEREAARAQAEAARADRAEAELAALRAQLERG